MRYVLAAFPIGLVLVVMMRWRWPGHWAGTVGWLAGLIVALFAFGLNWSVFWVSQVKGLILSTYVLAVMWPALFLFHWHDVSGGTRAVLDAIQRRLPEPGYCALVLAWALSASFEGLAGFGLPVAIVSPMLVALGIRPLRAVAAVAVGHAWSVTFGDMGIIFQTLSTVTALDTAQLIAPAALLLSVACLGCGLGAAAILGELRHWRAVVLLALIMSAAQYGVARVVLPLSAFAAGILGVIGAAFITGRSTRNPTTSKIASQSPCRAVGAATFISSYAAIALALALITLVPVLKNTIGQFAWRPAFPEVGTELGFITAAGVAQTIRPFTHPGVLILLVASVMIALRWRSAQNDIWFSTATRRTVHSAGLASLTVILMVGLATLMEHSGMTVLLAKGTAEVMGRLFPLTSPAVGILGAFATGSNNNSNIMFGGLQKQISLLLGLSPALLVAAQSAGGSLGSLIAPAKIAVGCSTVDLAGQEGAVLRLTLPYGIALGLLLGLVTLGMSLSAAGN